MAQVQYIEAGHMLVGTKVNLLLSIWKIWSGVVKIWQASKRSPGLGLFRWI